MNRIVSAMSLSLVLLYAPVAFGQESNLYRSNSEQQQSGMDDKRDFPTPMAEVEAAIPPGDRPGAAGPAWNFPVPINGFLSTSYIFAPLQPRRFITSTNVLVGRSFDRENNSISLDLAEIVAQWNPTKLGESGFKIRLGFGRQVLTGLTSDLLLARSIIEGFASYIVPVGEGIRIDAGTFVTHVGSELIEGTGGFNHNYSHSFLFNYGPYMHTGVRAFYSLDPTLTFLLMVANGGWDYNTYDINSFKSFGGQILYAPASDLSLALNYIGGAELSNINTRLRHMLDFVANKALGDMFVFNVNAVFGVQQPQATQDRLEQWWGIAAIGRVNVGTLFSLALRGEYFDDRDSVLGFNSQVVGVTLTPTIHLGEHADLRLEGRYDMGVGDGGDKIFYNTDGLLNTAHQVTIAANAIAYF